MAVFFESPAPPGVAFHVAIPRAPVLRVLAS
jgi:hypothetical protein